MSPRLIHITPNLCLLMSRRLSRKIRERIEIIGPEAKLEYVYPIYDLKEHPKFAKCFNEAFNAEHIVKEVEYNKYIAIAIIIENDRITRKGIIEGKKYSYNKSFNECLGIKTLTKEQREYFEKKREARKNKHNKKNKKLNKVVSI